MSQPANSGEAKTGRVGFGSGILIWLGGVGLIGAMMADSLAVVGRHVGLALPGSIELVQAFVVIGASCAIAYASIAGRHASVDLLFRRMPGWAQKVAVLVGGGLSVFYIVVLIAGSGWIAWETWGDGEQTDILGIPLRWLRLFWLANATIAATAFAVRMFKSPEAVD